MSPPRSVTQWIEGVRDGDDAAFERIWQRYYGQLVRLVRQRMTNANVPRRVRDEDDIAVSAFDRFHALAKRGQFPPSADRDDLWRLLLKITAGKVVDHARTETRKKRGGGWSDVGELALFELEDDVPSPEFVAQMAEEFRLKMELLKDDRLQEIALAKFAGKKNAEIAEQTDCSLATVERRLKLIRAKWTESE